MEEGNKSRLLHNHYSYLVNFENFLKKCLDIHAEDAPWPPLVRRYILTEVCSEESIVAAGSTVTLLECKSMLAVENRKLKNGLLSLAAQENGLDKAVLKDADLACVPFELRNVCNSRIDLFQN